MPEPDQHDALGATPSPARFRLRGVTISGAGQEPVFYRFDHEDHTMTQDNPTPGPLLAIANARRHLDFALGARGLPTTGPEEYDQLAMAAVDAIVVATNEAREEEARQLQATIRHIASCSFGPTRDLLNYLADTIHPEETEKMTDPAPAPSQGDSNTRLVALDRAIHYSAASYLEPERLVALASTLHAYIDNGTVPPAEAEQEAADKVEFIRSAIAEPKPAMTQEDPCLGPELAPRFTDGGRTRVPGFSVVPHPVYLRAFELALEAAEVRGTTSALNAISTGTKLSQLLADAMVIGNFLKTGEVVIPTDTSEVRQGSQAFDQMERLRGHSTSDQAKVSGDRRGISGCSIATDVEASIRSEEVLDRWREAGAPFPGDEFAPIIDKIGGIIKEVIQLGETIATKPGKSPYR